MSKGNTCGECRFWQEASTLSGMGYCNWAPPAEAIHEKAFAETTVACREFKPGEEEEPTNEP